MKWIWLGGEHDVLLVTFDPLFQRFLRSEGGTHGTRQQRVAAAVGATVVEGAGGSSALGQQAQSVASCSFRLFFEALFNLARINLVFELSRVEVLLLSVGVALVGMVLAVLVFLGVLIRAVWIAGLDWRLEGHRAHLGSFEARGHIQNVLVYSQRFHEVTALQVVETQAVVVLEANLKSPWVTVAELGVLSLGVDWRQV